MSGPSSTRKAINLVVYLLFLALLTGLMWKHWPEVSRLFASASPLVLAGLLALSMSNLLIRGAIIKLTLSERKTISLVQAVHTATITTLGNYFPFGGLAVKGAVAKQQFELPVPNYLVMTLYTGMVGIGVGGLLGLVSAFQFETSWFAKLVIVGLSAAVLVPLVPLPPSLLRGRLEKFNAPPACRTFFLHRMLPTALLLLTHYLVNATRVLALIHLLGYDASFFQIQLSTCATMVTRLAPFTPGGLGIREGLIAAFGALASLDPGVMLLVAGLDRGLEMLSLAAMYLLSGRANHPAVK